jgi:hypothetical protein
MYPCLAVVFFATIFICLALMGGLITRPPIWKRHLSKIKKICVAWFIPYAVFILFFTGPDNLTIYPPQQISPFKLPWSAGVARLVSQGNRSFTSHRGSHLYAWDFVMPIGTPILAAGNGEVVQVEMDHEGIGLHSNIIVIQHAEGIRTGYAHLKKNSEKVKVGDQVKQGQMIGLSGMTGQTLFPHLHFFATDVTGLNASPISFRDVQGGIPFAGHFYTSGNGED